ncbi:MAG: M36 family metallopeptidase [Acidobacteriota bacterium]
MKNFLFISSLICVSVLFLIRIERVESGERHDEKSPFRTRSLEKEFRNYDIREDKTAEPILSSFSSSAIGRFDDTTFSRSSRLGEAKLRERIPTLLVQYDAALGNAAVIALDVKRGRALLTGPSREKHSEILRSFIKENVSLMGLGATQAENLLVKADYTNPDGGLSYAHLEQMIGGIPVFRGEIKAGFTKDGEMFRVINDLAPALDDATAPKEFGEAEQGVRNAFAFVSRPMTDDDIRIDRAASDHLRFTFGSGDSATVAEKMYFPIYPGTVRASWRVLIWQPVNAYYVIVDAETGTLLWRKNLTSDQTQSATYGVYNCDSPGPLSPTTALPGSGIQGSTVNRTSFTLIGNEAPNLGHNDLGWMTDGTNMTDGNNVEAGLDAVAPDGVDAPAIGDADRVFDFSYDPPPAGTQSPSDAAYRNGAATNVFYWANRYHDLLYSVGFNEAAGNFQGSNFGRGGAQNDRLRAEIQDFSGVNNANFTTPADGQRPRMQTYIFSGPNPQRDAALDAEVFLHEMTHGLSNRLIGNGTGLNTERAEALDEGWADFYARLTLATPDEDVAGIYPIGGYSTLNFPSLGSDNYYYGIRRFPYALKTTVGANGRPHNPLTFADIDIREFDVSDGAFPASPALSLLAGDEHNDGEVWCMALLEMRARIITSLGFNNGTKRVAQIVTDGMKLTPTNPNFTQARDAIIAADEANFAGADVNDIWIAFASRGLGFGAEDGPPSVVESFDLPNAMVVAPFSVSDATGNNNGFPEPGEHVMLSVSVSNTIGSVVQDVVVTTEQGTSASYGNIASGNTKVRQIPYTIPFTTHCGRIHKVTLSVTSGNAPGPNVAVRKFRLGVPPPAPPRFSNTAPITINDGGFGNTPAPASPYGNTIFVSGLSGTKSLRVGFTGFSHPFPGDVDMLLVGPHGQKMIIMSDAIAGPDAVNTNFSLVDSAADPLPENGALLNDGEYRPTNYGAFDIFPPSAPAAPYFSPEPIASTTFTSLFGTDGANLNGTWQLYIVDDLSGFVGSVSGGWYLEFASDAGFACSFAPPGPPRADFDGDGRSDVSVQRPGDGSWFAVRSSDGGTFTNTWGNTGDVTTPGDFDGDGKTDLAVYRPSSGQWFVLRSSDSSVMIASWGNPGDVAEAADFDGDGKTDVAVYRPSTGVWYVLRTSDGGVSISGWGNAGDVPVPADYDGDGKTDVAVYRPSTGVWYMLNSTTSVQIVGWGQPGDKPVEADYDGDGKDDIAVYRPSDNNWYVLNSSTGIPTIVNWGNSTDQPVPADYDGDGKDDIAVFRQGNWYILKSTGGVTITALGTTGDVAIPARYIP